MTAIVTEIVDWLRPAFTTAGYAIVPTAMFLESAAFLGVLVPGDVILAVAGVYAAAGEMSVPIVIVLGIAGALAGETAGYVVGRRYGRSAIGHLPFADRIGRKVDRASEAINTNAGKTIVVGRFATGVAGVVPFAAGMADVPMRTFFLYSVPLVVGWATGVVLLGTLVGNNVELIDRILSSIGWFVLGAAILVIAGRWAWRRRRSADPSP
ncbi:MAG TPA: DedA family protein [Actinomycetota bacterium]|nr:DedA family protein [Actinomycetota bacterium]